MDRLTLSEAQGHVATIERDEGVPFGVDWKDPLTSILDLAGEARRVDRLSRRGIALLEARLVVTSYLRHLLFEEGKAFADERAAAFARKHGAALVANMIRDGYHYAEPGKAS